AHAQTWRLLKTAATTYSNSDQYAYIVAGKFYRGYKRGGGRWVNTFERDHTRALQLMQQALPLAQKDGDRPAVAHFHLHFAQLLLNGAGWHEPWRLQYLTDLGSLPDYEDGYRYYHGQGSRGAPVDE